MKGRESGMPDEDYWGTFFNPRCILERLGCAGDVVEVGCGYGTFTVPAAQLTTGRVYALDIEPDMIAEVDRKARVAGLSNVVAEVRDVVADGCGLPDASADYVALFNILHIENPVGLLREARRVLKPSGTVGIIHWRTDIPTPRGPSPDIRPTADQCRAWGEAAGLEFVRSEELCCCSWHWGMVMRRAAVPFLPPLTNDAATPEARSTLESLQAKLGQVPNMYRTFAHAPNVLSAAVSMATAIRSDLDPKVRELAYLKVTHLTDCHV